MAEIKVSTKELRDVATSISSINVKLSEILDKLHSESSKLVNNSWTSDAATEFLKKINNFKATTFDNYKNYTEEYAKFLTSTAEKYEATEETNYKDVTLDINDSAVGKFDL